MRYIVTLTSYGNRLEATAPYAIYSLLNQTVAPDIIVLWLAHNTAIPPSLEKLIRLGLQIKFCNDIKSYKKLIPALREFPNDVLITADDDTFYPKNWLEQLKSAFLKDPSKIYAHRAHEILVNTEGNVLPYKDWNFCCTHTTKETSIFPTGVGGVLFPPYSLSVNCTDEELFLSLAPTADDIWFWAMAKMKNTKYCIIENGYHFPKNIDLSDTGLWINNINNGENDKQFKAVVEHFPVLKEILQKIEPSKLTNGSITKEEEFTFYKIVVLVPFRNVGHYIIDCINSITGQMYNNYEIYLLDDASDDETLNLIHEEIENIHKISRKRSLGATENIYNALIELPIDDEDIVLLLDGDDYLFGDFAFQIVNEKYNNGTLVTGGRLINNYGQLYQPFLYSKEQFENLRNIRWINPHPKTFKYKVFKAFLEQDPEGKNLKSDDGKFYKYTSDMALMFPLMEIAGFENVSFISNIIYCYRQHSNNVHASENKRVSQLKIEREIRRRSAFKKVFY